MVAVFVGEKKDFDFMRVQWLSFRLWFFAFEFFSGSRECLIILSNLSVGKVFNFEIISWSDETCGLYILAQLVSDNITVGLGVLNDVVIKLSTNLSSDFHAKRVSL